MIRCPTGAGRAHRRVRARREPGDSAEDPRPVRPRDRGAAPRGAVVQRRRRRGRERAATAHSFAEDAPLHASAAGGVGITLIMAFAEHWTARDAVTPYLRGAHARRRPSAPGRRRSATWRPSRRGTSTGSTWTRSSRRCSPTVGLLDVVVRPVAARLVQRSERARPGGGHRPAPSCPERLVLMSQRPPNRQLCRAGEARVTCCACAWTRRSPRDRPGRGIEVENDCRDGTAVALLLVPSGY